jgi:hypothetical protein
MITRTKSDAAELALALHAGGHLVAHAGGRTWIEFHGTLAEARAALSACQTSVNVEGIPEDERAQRLQETATEARALQASGAGP